ncbi:hypothetical protein HMI54_004418 [Coelomomyces lativittatus]|nr:hypothetical protein HMI54_004418 [Coelomomyces lativittatus]
MTHSLPINQVIENESKTTTSPCMHTFHGNFELLNHPFSPLRQRNPTLKTLISIGGWTLSKG